MSQSKLSLGQAIDQIITALEGLDETARKTAVETVCAHLGISLSHPRRDASPASGAALHKPDLVDHSQSDDDAKVRVITPTDIRSFRAAKSPKSAREMACVVAFYLQELAPEGQRADSVSAPELEKYFKQAQFKLPEKIGQVLPDAKRSGYFDSAAHGKYKLNAVGYNLVAHKLPANPPAA
jgi:hypothetical protein